MNAFVRAENLFSGQFSCTNDLSGCHLKAVIRCFLLF